MKLETPFTATAVWLRKSGDAHAEVLLEIDGTWRLAIREFTGITEYPFGTIAEGNGQKMWPADNLTANKIDEEKGTL